MTTRMIAGKCRPYNEARPLSFLLCHLLSFYSTCVLSAESEVGNGNIIQIYVEILRPLGQDSPDISADHLPAEVMVMTCTHDYNVNNDIRNANQYSLAPLASSATDWHYIVRLRS